MSRFEVILREDGFAPATLLGVLPNSIVVIKNEKFSSAFVQVSHGRESDAGLPIEAGDFGEFRVGGSSPVMLDLTDVTLPFTMLNIEVVSVVTPSGSRSVEPCLSDSAASLPEEIITDQMRITLDAFIYAASKNQTEVVEKRLLQWSVLPKYTQSCFINWINADGETALGQAAKNNNVSCVKLLLSSGASCTLLGSVSSLLG